jgi:cysteine desulfurase / selenocysteine lyase
MPLTQTQALSPSEQQGFEAARARFPGTSAQAYIDVASRSLIPGNAPELAFSHLTQRVQGRVDKHAYFEMVEKARRSFATLIGAADNEVAITKNVSEGLNIVAASLAWRSGDEVFVCSAVEHPNNVYTWRNLQPLGVSVRDFPSPDGLFPIDAVIEALQGNSRARVVTVSATSFKPGFRVDLDRLGAACKKAGAYLVVDGAQSAGITHLDLAKTHVDALAVSTQKGLCSLYGMGFLYVRKEFAETLTPRYLARFGVAIDASHEADYDPGPVKYQHAAQRFDLGNYNFLAALLVGDTLDLINGLGTQAIDRHVTHLATELSNGLLHLGAPVAGPAHARRANMVCIESQQGSGAAFELQQHLQKNKVQAAVRRNMIRFSFHLYNNMADVEAALQACKTWLAPHGASLRKK